MGELLPCPFCGSNAKLGGIRDGQQVFCTGHRCFARGPAVFHGPGGWEACERDAITAWNARPRTEGRGEGEQVASDKALFDALWELVAAMANEGIPQTPRTKAAFKVAHQAALDRLRKDWSSPIREPEISREALIKVLADHFGFRPYEQMAEDKSDLRGKVRDGYDVNEPTKSDLAEVADAILNLAPVGGRGEGWRPIETAPKDGTRFLSWPAHLDGGVTAAVETWWYEHPSTQGWITDAFDCGDYEFAPTHWQPLPPPPQEQEEGSSQSQDPRND